MAEAIDIGELFSSKVDKDVAVVLSRDTPTNRQGADQFASMVTDNIPDYSLNNPDTLTKYKTAAQISHKVLETVTGGYLPGLFEFLLRS